MSTFIEITPVESTTKISQYVRIDNDFEITVGVNTGGTLAYSYYDFSGIPSDYVYRPDPADDNVEFVQIVKDQLAGTAIESLTIRIKMFYNASDDTLEPHEIPRAWTYGRPIDKDHYQPGVFIDTLSQTFPIEIWDTRADGATQPVAHTANPATAPTFGRLYARLGTVAARRDDLKTKLRGIVDDPMLPFIVMGSSLNPIVSRTSTVSTTSPTLLDDREHAKRMQGFAFRTEMLARAISVDANLNTEAKFNLLNGEIGLPSANVFMRLSNTLNADIANQMPRAGWRFRPFGSVASIAPFTYTAPTHPTAWPTTHDSSIDVGSGVASEITEDWIGWLRS